MREAEQKRNDLPNAFNGWCDLVRIYNSGDTVYSWQIDNWWNGNHLDKRCTSSAMNWTEMNTKILQDICLKKSKFMEENIHTEKKRQ